MTSIFVQLRSPAIALMAVTLVGCASSGGQTTSTGSRPVVETVRVSSGSQIAMEQSQSSETLRLPIHAPIADVWRALPAVYTALGIPVTFMDSSAYRIGTTSSEVRRTLGGTMVTKYFDCGANRGGASALSYDLFVSVTTQLASDASGASTIATSLRVQGKPITYSGDPVNCESLGTLERKIAEETEKRVAH